MGLVVEQSAPLATTETDLYTVPANKEFVGSSLYVCNRGSTLTTFRIAIVVGGGATQNKSYRYYDVLIPGNDTFVITTGLCGLAGTVFRVYAGNGNLSFNLDGEETP